MDVSISGQMQVHRDSKNRPLVGASEGQERLVGGGGRGSRQAFSRVVLGVRNLEARVLAPGWWKASRSLLS